MSSITQAVFAVECTAGHGARCGKIFRVYRGQVHSKSAAADSTTMIYDKVFENTVFDGRAVVYERTLYSRKLAAGSFERVETTEIVRIGVFKCQSTNGVRNVSSSGKSPSVAFVREVSTILSASDIGNIRDAVGGHYKVGNVRLAVQHDVFLFFGSKRLVTLPIRASLAAVMLFAVDVVDCGMIKLYGELWSSGKVK